MKAPRFLFIQLLIVTCGGLLSTRAADPTAPATNSISPPLRNGIYAVLNEATTPPPTSGAASSQVVLIYDRRKYGEAPQNEPPVYVTVDRSGFVPLVIQGTPKLQKDANGRSMLSISLAHEQAKLLEDFTRAHLGGRVATVLDGEIITLNKIRSVIVGGEVQMTRCSDDACRIVRAKLTK